MSNSDPVTGQAGWYDVRVRIYPAAAGETRASWPEFPAMRPLPGVAGAPPERLVFVAGKGPRT
jgi:hypothetical protein